jgi:hypothetical protein
MALKQVFNALSGSFDLIDVTSSSDITGTALSGFVSATGTVTSSDTIETAIEKINGNTSLLGGKYVRTTRFASVGAGTTGTITIPANNTIILDDFGGTVDAIICPFSGGRPDPNTHVLDTVGYPVATTFDASGNFVLSGTPSAYPVALVYRTRVPLVNSADTDSDIMGGTEINLEASARWTTIAVTNAMSPFTPTQYAHCIFSVDLSGGSVVFNLPAVTTASNGTALILYVEDETSTNTLTVNTSSGQLIQGRTSHVFQYNGEGFYLLADGDAPFHWEVLQWLTNSSAGKANYAEARAGLSEWYGSGAYWSIVGTTFTLLRGGRGFIRGNEVIWAAGQTYELGLNEYSRASISKAGTLTKVLAWDPAVQSSDYISLFTVLRDAGGATVVTRADWKYSFDHGVRAWVSRGFGAVVAPIQYGEALMTRYGTGTGAGATDRQINISAGGLLDGDILESWSSTTTGQLISHSYTNTSSQVVQYSSSKEFPMFYSSSGTPTAISVGSYGVFRVYLSKSNLNNAPPQAVSEMHTAQFASQTAAQNAINAGTIAGAATFNPEVAQLGYVMVLNNASGGYVRSITTSKKTLAQYSTGGSTGTASTVNAVTTAFDKVLSAADTTVQAALDTIDENSVSVDKTQIISGAKTFSLTISGSIDGNAGTVTGGVYTSGNQTIAGVKTFSGLHKTTAGQQHMWREITATGAIEATDYYVDCNHASTAIVATLPTAASLAGTELIITRTNLAGVRIVCTGTETINSSTFLDLPNMYSSVSVHSNGTNWIIH